MKVIKTNASQLWMINALIVCLLLFAAPLAAVQDETSAISLGDAQVIQGQIKRVFPENNLIIVKPDKGSKVQIQVDEQTDFVGIVLLENLKKGKRVKVWFTVDGDENRAVKLEKLPEVGC